MNVIVCDSKLGRNADGKYYFAEGFAYDNE
jgi:hypothetical protein